MPSDGSALSGAVDNEVETYLAEIAQSVHELTTPDAA
jgi:hypothetical protein